MNRPQIVGTAAIAATLMLSGCAALPDQSTAGAVDVTSVGKWMDRYLEAWESKDSEAVMALFSEDAVYQSVPGVERETFVGREAIGEYWDAITAGQSDIEGVRGVPIVDGNQASIEIWVTFVNPDFNPEGDHYITLLEANILTFDEDGLVTKNAEYYNIQMGKLDPPAGWGGDQ